MKRIINLMILALFASLLVSCFDTETPEVPTAAEEQIKLKDYLQNIAVKGYNIDTTDLGVYYVKIKEGTGEKAKVGDTLTVGYAGYLVNGALFGSTFNNNPDSTDTFVLGNPVVMKGWDDGMKLMNKNSKYQLVIPSSLAFGSEGNGIIPPYQTLVFVVIMKDIKPKK